MTIKKKAATIKAAQMLDLAEMKVTALPIKRTKKENYILIDKIDVLGRLSSSGGISRFTKLQSLVEEKLTELINQL